MIKKMKLLLLPIAISLGMTTQVIANDGMATQSVDDSGFWIGAGMGMSIVDKGEQANVINEALGFKLEAGYDFNRNFGIYTNYDYMNYLGDTDLHLGTLGIKGNYYFTQNLSVFGKLGATYIFAEDAGNHIGFNDSFNGTAGLGFEYQLTNSVSTKIGYDYYLDLELRDGQQKTDLLGFYWGLTYKFGQPDTPMVINKNVDVFVEVVKEVQVEIVKEVPRSKFVLPYKLDQVNIDDYGHFNLNEIIQTLKSNTELTVEIIGRTNSIGTVEVNERVSKLRANTVYQYFIDNGIDKSRLIVRSVSAQDPLTDNSKSAIERSVEVIIK
jgi:OOP family OmpA-OmpF porin